MRVTEYFRMLFPLRCSVDGSPMHKLGSTSDGHPVYECEYSHTCSPAVPIKKKSKEESRGIQRQP